MEEKQLGRVYGLSKTYKKIAWGFFGLSVLTSAFIFYLIWAKVTIIITAGTEQVSQDFNFTVKETASVTDLAEGSAVIGKIQAVSVEDSLIFPASGSKLAEGGVVGEVTIINNYSQPQTLVATTRLAAPEDPGTVLVRLNRTVTVPPGSQLEVQVYSENPEDFQSIEPTRFIIPGLWGPLQESIYAENAATLSPEGSTIAVATQSDFDQAEAQLKDSLYQKALSMVNESLAAPESLWPKLVTSNVDQVSIDAEVGEEVAEFSVTMKLNAVVVVFDESQVISLARNNLRSNLSSDKQLVDLDSNSLSYHVEEYNLETHEADVSVSLSGSAMLGNSAELLDTSKLVGMTAEEVEEYFARYDEVESVEVNFFPGWLKKTPRIKEKIEIKISN